MTWSYSPRRAGAGLLLAVGLCLLCSRSAHAVTPLDPATITFDNIAAPPGNPNITELFACEYRFTSDYFHTIADPAGGSLPLVQNGSLYIAEEAGPLGKPITIRRTDGAPFALLGLDGAEAFLSDVEAALAGFPNATTLLITAEVLGGGTANISLPLDGIKDGPAGAADFQPFDLPPEFCGILSATFSGRTAAGAEGAIALDNIDVAAVIPEPTTFILAVMAAFATAVCARAKQARRHF